jgi:hypothetical protein
MKSHLVEPVKTGLTRKSKVRAAVAIGCVSAATAMIAITLSAQAADEQAADRPWMEAKEGAVFPAKVTYANDAGRLGIINQSGDIQIDGHPFFEPQGDAGRACVTCHQPADAMSLSVESIQQRWELTQGADPLFHPFDGANCPDQTRGERSSHSLLLDRGLIRIGLPWPPKADDGSTIDPEFTLEVVRDPAGCNTSPVYGLNSENPTVSVYRRPRMSANLRYMTTPFSLSGRFNGKTGLPLAIDPATGQRVGLPIMADARATNLRDQAHDALSGHMQLIDSMTDEQVNQIVAFESQVYAAQESHNLGGSLVEEGSPPALGPMALVTGESIVGGFNWRSPVFFDFDSWRDPPGETQQQRDFRASVARGYDIFFDRPMWIRDVAWFNSIGMGNPYKRSCAICHSVHLTGSDISPGLMDLGVNNLKLALGTNSPDLPVFKVTCKDDALPHPYLGREFETYDPGRALITGKCQDIGSLVMQQLRGLSARAPYFSNGSAETLRDVVDYYDERFVMEMTEQDKQDLTNFLSVL